MTGHTGFKGSWLSLWLHQLGAEVYGYALAPDTTPSLFELTDLKNKISSTIADVRDYEALLNSMKQCNPDIVIHMAAQPLVRYSYDYPLETFATNVMGTANLLEAVRHCDSVKVVVNVTTDKCYENKEWCWGYRESEPMGGKDPYSSSKACSELVTTAYRHSFLNPQDHMHHGKAIASARAGNVIGGGDWAQDRLIPDIIQAFLNNKTVNIRSPLAIRPWQHVLEPLSGYLQLAEKLWEDPVKYAEAWNFGPKEDDVHTVESIVKFISEDWGSPVDWQIDSSANHPHEAGYLKLDISKAKTYLDWQPQWSLQSTLRSLIKWYQCWHTGDDIVALTLKQIEEYQAKLS